jgi:hypothetical protein
MWGTSKYGHLFHVDRAQIPPNLAAPEIGDVNHFLAILG